MPIVIIHCWMIDSPPRRFFGANSAMYAVAIAESAPIARPMMTRPMIRVVASGASAEIREPIANSAESASSSDLRATAARWLARWGPRRSPPLAPCRGRYRYRPRTSRRSGPASAPPPAGWSSFCAERDTPGGQIRRSGASTQTQRTPALTCGTAVDRSVPVLSGGLPAGLGGGAGLLRGTALLRAVALLRCAALRRAGLLRSGLLRAGALLRAAGLPAAAALLLGAAVLRRPGRLAAPPHAALEGVHQADHRAALLGGLVGVLLAEGGVGVHRHALLELRLVQTTQLRLVLVGEPHRLEVVAELLDQGGGHRHLVRGDLRLRRPGVDLLEICGPAQRLQG